MTWTDDQIAFLKKHYVNKDLSTKEIAKKIGKTESAIYSYIKRNKLTEIKRRKPVTFKPEQLTIEENPYIAVLSDLENKRKKTIREHEKQLQAIEKTMTELKQWVSQ